MSVERRGTKALELWARRATDGYAGVSISNMTTAWRNGLAFCALIHHFRPDLIEFSSLKAENILENNALAFRVAEQQLGIPALLDAEDMVECDIPDRLSVLTYVSQFYQVFSSLGLTSPKRVANVSPPPSSPVGVKKTKLSPPQPQPKTKTEIKSDKVLGGGRLRREVCAKCNNPVFLAERLLVGSPGQLMHRTCFRCARCTTQLTLASYYETEKGQFCCETCPDEELKISPEAQNSINDNSPILSRRMSTSDSESEYDSDGSENESDTYSNTVELVLEDKKQNDALANSPKVTPEPPKPRTVFLSKTLEKEDPSSNLDEHKDENLVVKEKPKFSEVSPALFGSREKGARASKASDSSLDHCDDAKGSITNPPDKLTLDTGQNKSSNYALDSASDSHSSIVAQRLKMFREISNQSNTTSDAKTNISVGKIGNKEKDLLQKSEKDSSLQDTVSKAIDKNSIEIKDGEKGQLEEKVTTNDYKDGDSKSSEKSETDSLRKDIEITSAVPSIVVSKEIQNATDSEDEMTEAQVPSDKDKEADVPTTPYKIECLKGSDSDCNPFEGEEDESQLEESGVTAGHSREGTASDIENNATSLSQDSGAEMSSASLRSSQYPEDLNPFGSDEENEDAAIVSELAVAEKSESNENRFEGSTKKLIKANLNPFESDEDEEATEVKDNSVSEKKESKNLNPFWSDDEEPLESPTSTPSKGKSKPKPPRPPPPTLARNCSPSHLYQNKDAKSSPATSPARELFPQAKGSPSSSQARLSPSLPTAKGHPSPSSPSGSVALRRKARRAPAPPTAFSPKSDAVSSSESTADTMSVDTMSLSSLSTQGQGAQGPEDEAGQDEVLNRKMQKDMKNHSNKMNGAPDQRIPPPKPARAPHAALNLESGKGLARKPSMSKSEAGEWQRKKGPAPLRPVPQKRAIKKMPMRLVQQELHDIEVKQTELERQGVLLETSIRKRTEGTPNNPQDDAASVNVNSGPSSIEVEDMIMQLFELVNEKNELFRRQTELMYLKREKRLEEEYVELEYQIRCLMLKPPSEKTESDTIQEEELISRLVKLVEQRDEIINCLELDRLREAQEDESIATHMMQYQEKHIDGVENGCVAQTPKKKKTLKLPRKKKKKEKKDKKGTKADADKDIDETEVKETKKKKKKWLF